MSAFATPERHRGQRRRQRRRRHHRPDRRHRRPGQHRGRRPADHHQHRRQRPLHPRRRQFPSATPSSATPRPKSPTASPEKSVSIRDDSGSQIRFTSAGTAIRNPFFDPAFPNAGIPEFIGSRMSFVTYPIRGSGGSVVINATSESGMSIDVQDGPAEIGRVEIAGLGRAVLNGTFRRTRAPTPPTWTACRSSANDVVDDPDSPTGTRQSLVLDPRELTADTVADRFCPHGPGRPLPPHHGQRAGRRAERRRDRQRRPREPRHRRQRRGPAARRLGRRSPHRTRQRRSRSPTAPAARWSTSSRRPSGN